MQAGLPPGQILLLRYLRDRLRSRKPQRFVEVGVGSGELTAELLELGWTGVGYDLNDAAIARAAHRNSRAVAEGRLELRSGDYIADGRRDAAALVVSQMVLEHLPDDAVAAYMRRSRDVLSPDGLNILIVPARPSAWGIEDEIAGHLRRYTAETLRATLEGNGFVVRHIAGLTFPISNALLPLSNWIVGRAEAAKREMPLDERTRVSGVRDVAYKTRFPPAAKLVLNEHVLRPLDALQRRFVDSERALVLYAEAQQRV